MSIKLDIRKNFGSFELDVSLDAGDEVMGLLGASGCGKSATLRCIAGLITPDEGHIEVNGTVLYDSASHINLKPQQRRTAMLFQNYQLFPNLTVRANVEAGIGHGVSKKERHAISDHYLGMFGLEGLADRYPMRLSGGQQQRVALARMLAAKPKILMFDEPFSALDSHLKSALEQSMLDAFDDLQGTILYVSHDIDEALRFCDRITVMDHGDVMQVAKGREIIDHPDSLASIRLSGCKNTSAARKVGAHEVEATDWGMRFTIPGEVPDDVAYVGIRAFYIRHDETVPEGAPNAFRLHVHRASDSRFERTVMLDTPKGDEAHRIQWKVDTLGLSEEQRAKLPEAGDQLMLEFDAQNLYLVNR